MFVDVPMRICAVLTEYIGAHNKYKRKINNKYDDDGL